MRRNSLIIAAAASLAIAGLTLPASAEDRPGGSSDNNGNHQSGQPGQAQPGGQQSSGSLQGAQGQRGQGGLQMDQQQGVRDALARLVEDATTPGRFNELVDQMDRSERRPDIGLGGGTADRTSGVSGTRSVGSGTTTGTGTSAGTATGTGAGGVNSGATGAGKGSGAGGQAAIDTADLDAKIQQLQRDWKEKYNQEFSLRTNARQVFNESFARINTGDMLGDAAHTAGERQLPAGGATGSGQRSDLGTGVGTSGAGTAGTNSSGINGNATSGNSGVGTNTANTAGRAPASAADRADAAGGRSDNGAVVLISGAPNATPVTLRMISEGGAWRVQSDMDPQQLKANLIRQLDMIDREKANWPADQNEAYRAVAQHVLMAFNHDLTQPGAGNASTPNPNSGFGTGTGTGTSSGNNSTNGSKTNR
jgi:hypothetical protein